VESGSEGPEPSDGVLGSKAAQEFVIFLEILGN